jgi:hypothetical protein
MDVRLRWLFIFIAGCLVGFLAISGGTAAAQGGSNLLVNPGFEGFYQSYNYNQADRGVVLEFRIAEGWHPWYREQMADDPGWRYRRPEYRPGSYSYNGTATQQFFASFGTHEAGLLQHVSAVPGQAYRFSIAAYIWSSMGGNFFLSEQPGDAVVRVGIDPAGGTNPWSSSVVWSPFASFYDQWRVLSVDAVAASNTVTVFFWSHQQYPVVHNDVAVDEASLLPIGQMSADNLAAPTEPGQNSVAGVPAVHAVPTGNSVSADVDLRLRAGLYGRTLDVIPAGTAVTALGRSEDRNWTLVEYNGQQGWIASWLGVYSSPFDSLPVVPLN